jgi:hypothetical protein
MWPTSFRHPIPSHQAAWRGYSAQCHVRIIENFCTVEGRGRAASPTNMWDEAGDMWEHRLVHKCGRLVVQDCSTKILVHC